MLKGFGVTGYRSFGPDPQFIAPLSKINIFVGQNNVGKSNVMRLVKHVIELGAAPGSRAEVSDGLNRHDGSRAASLRLYVPMPLRKLPH